MSPAEILSDLEARLGALGGGSRLSHARHKTVRATVEWSYDLLDPAEQRAFRNLAVFAGGFDADAAMAVASGLTLDVFAARGQVGGRGRPDPVGADALPAARDRPRVRPRTARGERRARGRPRTPPAPLLGCGGGARAGLAAVRHRGASRRAPAGLRERPCGARVVSRFGSMRRAPAVRRDARPVPESRPGRRAAHRAAAAPTMPGATAAGPRS